MIEAVLEAQRECKTKTKTKAVGLLKEFLCCMLPHLFDISVVEKINNAKGDKHAGVIAIPYALDVSAEMLMASSDNRPADVKLVSFNEQNPDAKEIQITRFRLAPESAGSIVDQVESMVVDCSNSAGGSMEIPFIDIADDLYKRTVPKKQFESIKENVSHCLELARHYSERATQKKQSYFWIVTLPEEKVSRERYIDMVKLFKEKLPFVTVLYLVGRRIYCLPRLFFSKSGPGLFLCVCKP